MAEVAVNHALPLLDPPQWAERRRLINHLLRNVDGCIYLRGPAGAGKTRFLATLFAHLSEGYEVVKLDHPSAAALDNFARAAAVARSSAEVAEAGAHERAGEKPALLLLDNADELSGEALGGLQRLADNQGRAVLLGHGGPASLAESGLVRWIDLPPLTKAQTRAFAARLDASLAKRLGPEGIRALFLETGGLPGRIIGRIAAGGSGIRTGLAGRPLVWFAAGLAMLVAGALVSEQDRINAWFVEGTAVSNAPPAPSAAAPRTASADEVSPAPLPAPPSVVEAPAAVAEPAQRLLLDATTIPRKPPAIDLPTADILSEIVRQPWLDETPELPPVAASKQPAAPDPQSSSQGSTRTKGAVTRTAMTAEPQGPDGTLAIPVDAQPVAPQPNNPSPLASRPSPEPLPDPPEGSSLPGNAWLQGLPSASYTLQLVAARDLAALHRFAQRHGLTGQLAVFERNWEGRPWFALLLGSFPDRRSALLQRAKLPGRLAKEAWPRRLQDIHNLIKIKG